MCLAIPAKIIQLEEGNLATVDILGTTRKISIDFTPDAKLGDYVLVHAGFAIEIETEESAQQTLDLIREFPELAESETASMGLDGEQDSQASSQTSMHAMLSELAEEL